MKGARYWLNDMQECMEGAHGEWWAERFEQSVTDCDGSWQVWRDIRQSERQEAATNLCCTHCVNDEPHEPDDHQDLYEAERADAAGPEAVERLAEVVTLCGSTRFKNWFMSENQRLTIEGCVVISLGVFGHTDLPDIDWTTDGSDLKTRLDALHFQKIRMADRVHVIDPGGYVGESTRREIDYARSLGRPVTYLSASRTSTPEGAPDCIVCDGGRIRNTDGTYRSCRVCAATPEGSPR